MKRKLLVAGGAHSDIPMILAAQELGYEVLTSGNRATDLGHNFSDRYIPADFSDPEAILKIASEEKISALCSSCNDFSALSCSWVAEKLGLAGHDCFETALTIHHKDKFRAFALANGITSPMAASFSDYDSAIAGLERFSLPVIVKPVDLTGGKGVTRVEKPHDYSAALEKAFKMTRQGRVVVENFLSGSRHGLTILLVDRKAVFWMADDEYYYLNQYLVSGASTPTSVPSEVVKDLIGESEKIASLLKLCDGIFHVQFILYGGRGYIIEVCRRPPGDLYVNLVRHATGIDYPRYLIQFAAGIDCQDLRQVEPDGFYLRHCIMGERPGTMRELEFSGEVKDKIIDQFIWGRPGDVVSDIMTHKHGIVFIKFASFAEMKEYSSKMQSLIRAVIKD